MALTLNENQIGFDTQKLSFPSLGGCMAVALLTPSGMYGFHFTPASLAQANGFKDFFDREQLARNVTETAIHLYGSCRRGIRWHGDSDKTASWKRDMTVIANALNYSGKVSGCNLSKVSHGEKDDSAGKSMYLEYLRTNGATELQIRYKRMSKMDAPMAPTGTAGSTMGGALGILRVKETGWGTGQFNLQDPKIYVGANVSLDTTKTKSTDGKMHTPGWMSMDSFTV